MKKNSNKSTKNTLKNIPFSQIRVVCFIVLFIAILTGLILLFSDSKTVSNDASSLDIKYDNASLIKLHNIEKGTVYTNKIVIGNNTDKDMYYKIDWKDISNSFIEQNKLLYKIDTIDQDAFNVGESQLPVVNFTLFDKVVIRKNSKHTYKLSIYYKGNVLKERDSLFEGKLEFKQINK